MNAPSFRTEYLSEDIRFRADVAILTGKILRPTGRIRAAAVLHGATGVPAEYYRAFASWLTTEGIACLIYDYRDFGASARKHPRRSAATFVQWGLGDQPAAQFVLEHAFPGVPIWVIGHSFGGLMVPFHPGAGNVERLITVASGPVHFSDHPWPSKAAVAALWWGLGPLATRACGFLPGRRLGLGADLPAGVFWQWRRWCTSKGFFLSDVGRFMPMPDWQAFKGELRVVAVNDDPLVPPAAVWRLIQNYPAAKWRQKMLRPGDRPIGHIAAFSERHRAHWAEIIAED